MARNFDELNGHSFSRAVPQLAISSTFFASDALAAGINWWQIVVAVIAALVILLCVLVGCIYFGCFKKRTKETRRLDL